MKTKYLRINEGHYIRKDAILEVSVVGIEVNCEIRLIVKGSYSEPVIWRRFHSRESEHETALSKAYAEANRLICHDLEDPEDES